MPEMPKNAKDAKYAKNATHVQMQTDEFNHEGLFYHNSRGQKR